MKPFHVESLNQALKFAMYVQIESVLSNHAIIGRLLYIPACIISLASPPISALASLIEAVVLLIFSVIGLQMICQCILRGKNFKCGKSLNNSCDDMADSVVAIIYYIGWMAISPISSGVGAFMDIVHGTVNPRGYAKFRGYWHEAQKNDAEELTDGGREILCNVLQDNWVHFKEARKIASINPNNKPDPDDIPSG